MAKHEKLLFGAAQFFVYAASVIPLFFSSAFFFPYTFTKTFLFRAAVELAFLFWLPLIIAFPKYRPQFTSLAWAVTVLFAAGWISAVFGADFLASFWSDYERMMGLLTYSHFWVFFLMAISLFKSERDWVRLFNISLSISTLIAVYGIWQKFALGFGRVESTFGNASFLASYLLIHIFIALVFVARHEKLDARAVIYLGALFLLGLAFIFTGTRGALLGLAVGIFVLSACLAVKPPSSRVRFFARLFLAVFVILGATFFLFRENLADSHSELLRRFASVSLQDRTVKARLISWEMAWIGIKERPVLGWGPENFILLSNKYYDPRLYEQEAWFDRAHNILFDLTAAKGFVGALLLAVFIILLFWSVKKRESSFYEKATLVAGIASYLAASLFSFDNAATLIPLSLAAAYIAWQPGASLITAKTTPTRLSLFYSSAAISFALFIVIFWNVTVAPARDNFQAHAAWENLFKATDKIAAAKQYEQTVANGKYLDRELNRALADFAIDAKKNAVAFLPPIEKEMFETALRLMQKNIELDPKNVRWLVYQGNLYTLSRSFDPTYSAKAEEIFVKAIPLSPRRQQIYFDLAQAEFDQGKIDEAFKHIDAAIQLEPSYRVGYRHKAAFAIMAGRYAVAEEIIPILRNDFMQRKSPAEEYWDILADAYFKMKRFKEAAELYQETIDYYEEKRNPEKFLSPKELAERYARMAALWAMAGEKEKAYQAALRVVELDPARKGEAEAFLKTIGRMLP